jgi:uncharacterized RDD family membrane protein YckC
MQTVGVRTTQNVFIEYPVASVGDRILAHLADRLILVLYSVAIIAILLSVELEIRYLWFVLLAVPWLFYNLAFEIIMNGQTPGKRILKLQVVRLNGTSPTVGDYILRWIFSFVDFYILSGAIAVVIIAMGGNGQRLGDIIAGTTVIKQVGQREIASNEIFVPVDETHIPTFSQVVDLNDNDIELIQRALAANREQGNSQPVILITGKIKALLGIESDMPPVKFLYTIVKDYTNLTTGRENG